MAQLIARRSAAVTVRQAHIFFSAHGVPKSYVEKPGSLQKDRVLHRADHESLENCLGTAIHPAYQSRVGLWSGSSPTPRKHEELGEAKTVDLVVPISFVVSTSKPLKKLISNTGSSPPRRVL